MAAACLVASITCQSCVNLLESAEKTICLGGELNAAPSALQCSMSLLNPAPVIPGSALFSRSQIQAWGKNVQGCRSKCGLIAQDGANTPDLGAHLPLGQKVIVQVLSQVPTQSWPD